MLANIIIYTPASTGFNWAAVVGPLASGLVAAFTAVGVFVFSQRKERQKAHDDRVWVERMQAYTPVATWAFAWHEYYAHHVAKHVMKDLHSLDVPEPPRPKKVVVNTATNTRILIYGSPAVVQQFRQASVTNKQMADRFADNAGDMRDAIDGQSVMGELTAAIRREAGEGIDLAVPTPAKRKEKSPRWTRRSRAAKPGSPKPQAPLASSPAGAPESA